tara:strand:- start:202 stop:366 length:165 start_codon:yes stop_codon:yes gene_type:complete
LIREYINPNDFNLFFSKFPNLITWIGIIVVVGRGSTSWFGKINFKLRNNTLYGI